MLIPLVLAMGFVGGFITQYVSQYRAPCGNNKIGHRLAHITGSHMLSVCTAEVGKRITEGLAEGLRKEAENMTLKEMPKVGDTVRYVGKEFDFMTEGKGYEVVDVRGSAFYAIDDDGDKLRWPRRRLDVFEPVDNKPSASDLIANLALRVSELERGFIRYKTSTDRRFNTMEHRLNDAIENIETWAQETENVKRSIRDSYIVEYVADELDKLRQHVRMNSDDIATLDERTQIEELAEQLAINFLRMTEVGE